MVVSINSRRYFETRSLASKIGDKKYWSNKPCKHGHVGLRYTDNNLCLKCNAAKSRNYRKKGTSKYMRSPHPCKRGHLAPRSSVGNCIECQRLLAFKDRRKRPYIHLLVAARGRAKKRGVKFSLTKDWIIDRWTGRCELTGIPFKYDSIFSASIDRINNRRGYVPDNCRIVIMAVNALKGYGTDDQMYFIASELIRRRK